MEQESQAAAESPCSWINFKYMPCFILNHKFNYSVLAHGKPTVSIWKQTHPHWSYWWIVQALPATKNAPSQLTKRCIWTRSSFPTRKWDLLQTSPPGPSRKEKRHFKGILLLPGLGDTVPLDEDAVCSLLCPLWAHCLCSACLKTSSLSWSSLLSLKASRTALKKPK